MPSTSERLFNMFEDDTDAMSVLEAGGWTERDYVWYLPTDGREPTDHEWDAVQYLVEEWDHGIEPREVKS